MTPIQAYTLFIGRAYSINQNFRTIRSIGAVLRRDEGDKFRISIGHRKHCWVNIEYDQITVIFCFKNYGNRTDVFQRSVVKLHIEVLWKLLIPKQ